MADISSNNKRMIKDTILYMIAKSVEGVVGIVTISALTHIFSPDKYSDYILWNVLITTVAMMSIQWLSQSASRYLNDYEQKNEREAFYSTVFFAWLKVNIMILVLSLGLGLLLFRAGESAAPRIAAFMFSGTFWPIYLLAMAYFVTYNTSQLLIALLAVRRKSFVNMIISVCSSIGKLALIYLLSGIIGPVVEVIFISYILCDLAVIALACATLAAARYIRRKRQSQTLLASFGKYGAPLVGNLATTTVLNNSDRYIIEYHLQKTDVSTYSTSYSVVSAAFTMLSTAVMRGSYPTILKTYAQGDAAMTQKLVSQAVRYYLLLAVPAVAGIWAVSKPLAELLFAPEYVSGYKVMVWVALGMTFLGITEYSNKPWELSSKTWYIFRNSLIGGIVNLSINIFLMPVFGYMTAAYSTFIGFFVYFCLSKLGSRKYMRWEIAPKSYAAIIGSALVMALVIQTMMRIFPQSKLMLFVYVLVGVVVYVIALAISGEIKEEIRMATSLIRRRHA